MWINHITGRGCPWHPALPPGVGIDTHDRGRLPDVFRPVVDDVSAVALPWLRMSANDQIACAASINALKQCQAGSGPCDNEATVVETCKEAVYVTTLVHCVV